MLEIHIIQNLDFRDQEAEYQRKSRSGSNHHVIYNDSLLPEETRDWQQRW